VVGAVPTTLFRVHALRVYEAWASTDPPLPGAAVALACRAAAEAVRTVRDDQAVSVVWTGPSSPLVPVRSTVAVLCELIDAACDELLVVSFAAYRVEAVVAALGRAADRGVAVRLVLESAEESGGLLSRDAAAAFEALAGRVGLYVWPAEKRAAHGEGHAAMHAKCAVADRRLALVTSANLTGAGMAGNMELGLLVRGGDAPARIAAHFAALVADGVLEAVHR
jgi:cardiolipin synthase